MQTTLGIGQKKVEKEVRLLALPSTARAGSPVKERELGRPMASAPLQARRSAEFSVVDLLEIRIVVIVNQFKVVSGVIELVGQLVSGMVPNESIRYINEASVESLGRLAWPVGPQTESEYP